MLAKLRNVWWVNNVLFLRMWLGQSLSTIGNQFSKVALVVFVTSLSSDPMDLAIVTISQMLPILFSPLAGALIDRWNKQRVMVTVDIARTLLIMLLLWVSFLWQVYVIAFAVSALGIFFGPARSALIPEVVAKENLTSAVSLAQASSNLAFLLGPGLAGLSMALLGLKAAFIIDAATFLISAINLALLDLPALNKILKKQATNLWHEVTEGLRGIRKEPLLLLLVALITAIMLSSGLVNVAGMHYLRNVMGASEKQVGLVLSLSGLGAVLASITMSSWGKKWDELVVTFASALILGVVFISYYIAPGYVGVASRMLLSGVVGCSLFIPLNSLLYQLTPQNLRGRVFSIVNMLFSGIPLIGYVVAGWVLRYTDAYLVISSCGVFMVAATLFFISRSKSLTNTRQLSS